MLRVCLGCVCVGVRVVWVWGNRVRFITLKLFLGFYYPIALQYMAANKSNKKF